MIGQVYQDAKDFNKSIDYYRQSIKYGNITVFYSMDFELMAFDYLGLKQNDSARYYVDKAVKLLGSNIPAFMSDDIGSIYSELGADSLAIYYLRSSYNELTKHSIDYSNFAETTMGLSNYFKRTGMTDSSLYYARLSFITSKKYSFLEYLTESSDLIADYYKKKHNSDN